MKRRTLDIVFSVGGLVVAGMLTVLALVIGSNANFAKTYVGDQLIQQQITFKTADTLTAEEKQSACLVKYAGRPMTTGKQAECYANEFIGLHLKSIPNANGKTYAELGTTQTDLRTQIAAMAPADVRLAATQNQLTDVTAARETVFKGETLRGLLLTSYGFSVVGEKAGQAMAVAYGIAALMAMLGIAGLVHAFSISKDRGLPNPWAADTPEHAAFEATVREQVVAAAAKPRSGNGGHSARRKAGS